MTGNSKEEHEAKRLELTQKRENTIKEIEAHNKADDSFANMLVSLVELASNAYHVYWFDNCRKEEFSKLGIL